MRSLGYDFITLKVTSSRGRLWATLILYPLYFNISIYINAHNQDIDEIKKNIAQVYYHHGYY